jgi:hypothetical protein
VSKRNKILVLILSPVLLAGFSLGYYVWKRYYYEEPVDHQAELRSTLLTYLAYPGYTHPEFSEQLTGTKAKLEVNQRDEHLLYFSIDKEAFDAAQTLRQLCIDPKTVEFAQEKGGYQYLGKYRFYGEKSLFFRFPDSLFNVRKGIQFAVEYDPYTYTVSDEELLGFISNKTIHWGNYYITKNGKELDPVMSMNHGAYVSIKDEPTIKRFTDQLIQGCQTQEEKIQVLLNFVTNRIKYSNYEAHAGSEILKRPNEILMSGNSDCSGKTILFASFLEQIGAEYRLAYMKGHIAVYVKGNFPETNGYRLNVDGEFFHLAEGTCPDFRIGETKLLDERAQYFIQFIQKVGSPSVVINNSTGVKFEL